MPSVQAGLCKIAVRVFNRSEEERTYANAFRRSDQTVFEIEDKSFFMLWIEQVDMLFGRD